MLWVDEKYVKLISPRLARFQHKGGHLYACKCPLCGDSAKKVNKTRGYFHPVEGALLYACHNCGARLSFGNFLRQFDINLHQHYRLECFKEKMGVTKRPEGVDYNMFKTKAYVPNIFESLPLVRDLDDAHPAKQYCIGRVLPLDTFDFYYADEFFSWSKGNTDKFEKASGKDHARIIIPWRDRAGRIIGYTARAMSSSQETKYFRILVDTDVKEKFFGLDRLDENFPVYVVEGEIDSLMIPNCIAVGNGKLHTYINKSATYISDSDVRNPHIMRGVAEMIALGLKVCLLPAHLPKDLNEMAQQGLTSKDIMRIVDDNTFSGLEAKLKFNAWKKIL